MKMYENLGSIPQSQWDVIVIGAGAAGLMACLEMPKDLKILLLNRNKSSLSSSRWAQGGIAAVTRSEDSFVSHAEDTIRAGAGLCDGRAVRLLVEEAPTCVARLQQLGMEFDRDSESLATTLEAAHSHRRVLHVKDRTGRELVEVLEDQVSKRNNLFNCRGIRVTDLWIENNKCCGVQVFDGLMLHWIAAKAVVLASGGGGHLFSSTTNPSQSSGEGIALAWRAGAAIEDLEFVQFHPTALKLQGAPCFLISEALRGEGAVLVDAKGNSPVEALERRDLETRDKVSRALAQSMLNQKVNHLWLDLKQISSTKVETRFPTIIQRCREYGLDPLRDLIPVAPAAHYWMGGIFTDLNAETSLQGLYAIGEVACTGLHGANRLASNSLMECLVFARQMSSIDLGNLPTYEKSFYDIKLNHVDLQLNLNRAEENLVVSIEDLRRLCWDFAGLNRSIKGMKNALDSIKRDLQSSNENPLIKKINQQPKNIRYIFDEMTGKYINLLLDLTNRQLSSYLLLESCIFRKESRGGHFRSDSPVSLPYWKCHTRLIKGQLPSTRNVRN